MIYLPSVLSILGLAIQFQYYTLITQRMKNSGNLDQSEAQIKTVNFKWQQHVNLSISGSINNEGMGFEVRSQNPQAQRSEADNTNQYKRQLLKLMVKIKFQRFGFRQPDLETNITHHITRIEHLQQVSSRHLNDLATELFLDIFSDLIGERNLLSRLVATRTIQMMEEEREEEEMPARPLHSRMRQGSEEGVHVLREGGPEILCNICYNMSRKYCQEQCLHSFCIDCMKGYLHENLKSDNYFIKCPQYDCRSFVSINTVKALLQPKEFKRFLFFREKNQKELNPDNKFCSKADCGQVLECVESKLRCPKCKSQYCEICLQHFHAEENCDVVLKGALERTFETFQIKKCPNCKSPIEKSDGCNHMTCKKCRFEFCWLCQKKYSRHHFRYYNCFGCPGMQYENEGDAIFQRLKQICLYLLLPFVLSILLLCYVGALPIFIIGSFVVKPCLWSSEHTQFCQNKFAQILCCCNECCFTRFVAWMLLQPRALLYAMFVAPVKLTVMMGSEICQFFE